MAWEIVKEPKSSGKWEAIQEDALPDSNNKGFSGIGQDILTGAGNVFPSLYQGIKALPGEAYGAAQQFSQDNERFKKNIFSGLDKGARGILSTPANIIDYLSEKEILPSSAKGKTWRPIDFGVDAILGLNEQRPGDALTQMATSISPYARLGELGKLSSLGRTGARAGSQGLYSVGQNENPVTSALSVPALQAPIKGAIGLKNQAGKLAPSKMFRGNLSPQELLDNLRAASGTNTTIGNIVESPTLKKAFENTSSQVPFAGGIKKLQEIKGQVEGRASNLMSKLGKNVPKGDPNELVRDMLSTAFKEQNKAKNQLYDKVTEISEKQNFNVDLDSFKKLAKDTSKVIENSPLLKTDSAFKNVYRKIAEYKNPSIKNQSVILDKSGKPIKKPPTLPTIKEVKLVANTLYSEGGSLLRSSAASDRAIGKLYRDLAKKARDDVKRSIENNGSDALKKAFESAETNYKKKFSPFLDKEIYKINNPDFNPESLVRKIIKPGKSNDQYKLIKKVQELLPEKHKNTLGYAFLKSAENKNGEIMPKTLSKNIESLGTRQFKTLFPDEMIRKEILDYGKLRGMNEEALSMMANPKTGARNVQNLISFGGAGLAGTLGGGILGGALSIGSAILGAKKFNNWSTSPKVRQQLVKKMIENDLLKKDGKTPNVDKLLPLISTLSNLNTEK